MVFTNSLSEIIILNEPPVVQLTDPKSLYFLQLFGEKDLEMKIAPRHTWIEKGCDIIIDWRVRVLEPQKMIRKVYTVYKEKKLVGLCILASVQQLVVNQLFLDIVRDSSDTDTNLDVSEYEVESFSENEIWEDNSNTSSGSEVSDKTL